MLLRKPTESDVGFYLWLLQVMIVLGFTSVLIWLSLHPKTPTYTVVDFYIPALDGRNTTFPATNNVSRNTTLNFNLQISNPNEGIGIYHDDINVTLYYGNEIINGVNSIPKFYQGNKKSTRSEVSVKAVEQFWRAVFREVSNGTVDLRVGLVTSFRYRILHWKTKHHWIVLQGHVPVGSDGKIVGRMNIKLNHTFTKPKNGD